MHSHVKKNDAFLRALQICEPITTQNTVTSLPLISHSLSYDPFSPPHLKASFTLSCFIFCSISFSLSVLFFINSCYSRLLMFIFPLLSVSLEAFFSLQSSVLSTQRDSEWKIKAIHNLQDVLSAISIPTPQHHLLITHTHLLSISLPFSAL